MNEHLLTRWKWPLLAALAVYFLAFMGSHALTVPDEGRYPEIAREMLMTGDFVTPRLNGLVFMDKPALYYWLEAGAMALFGVNAWAIRLAPALYGILGCLLVLQAGTRLFNRRTGVVAALILATSPLYYLGAGYADMNLEVGVLIGAITLTFAQTRFETPGSPAYRRLLWISYLLVGLAFMTKGLMAVAFPGMVITAWMVMRWRWRELTQLMLVPGILLATAICLPWFWLMQQANPDFLSFFFVDQQFRRFTGSGFNSVQPRWFYAPIVVAGILCWSCWLWAGFRDGVQLARQRSPQGEAMLLLLLHVVLIFAFFSVPESKIGGYILPIFPPLALILAHAVVRQWDAARLPGWPSLVTGVLVLGFAGWALANTGKLVARYGDDGLDWRLHAVSAVFVGLGIWALLVAWRGRRGSRLAVPAATAVVLCLSVYVLQPFFAVKSVRGLAQELQPVLKADDEIVNYYRYYQDLPIYLKLDHPVTVVHDWNDDRLKQDNWALKLYMGYQRQPEAKGWLIGEDELARRLAGPRRVFVFVDNKDADALQARYHLHRITQGRLVSILANRDTALPRAVRPH